MPDLRIPKLVLERNDPGQNRVLATSLSAVMFYPKKRDQAKLLHFKARCLLQSVPFLMNHAGYSGDQAGTLLYSLAEEEFGGWGNLLHYIFSYKINDSGPGSLDALGNKGAMAGSIFLRIFYDRCSLAEAVDIELSEADRDGTRDKYGINSVNVVNNIWSLYKPVAHLWAALLAFEVPFKGEGYVALDHAVPTIDVPGLPKGLQGLVLVANEYYETAVKEDIRFKRSNKSLVDANTAWRIVVE